MGKEAKKSSKKNYNNKISSNTENDDIKEELKKSANNVKKEFVNAKDILKKGIKKNANNIKDKFTNKVVETKDKIVKEFDKNIKEENNFEVEKLKNKLDSILKYIKNKITLFIDYMKKMERKKLIIISVILFTFIFIIPNIFNNDIKYKYEYDYIDKIVLKYRVKINVEFNENLIFSKYDVVLTSNLQSEVLKHGVDEMVEFFLEEGEHTLTFISQDDTDISTNVTINVTSNMEVGFEISTHYNEISVTKKYTDKDEEILNDEIKIDFDKSMCENKNYKSVIEELEKLGFSNIEEIPMYDIVSNRPLFDEFEVDNVKIDGKYNYKRGDVFKNNVKIVVSYHMNANDDPSKIFPPYDKETASKKAYGVVVKAFKAAGFTNVIAIETANYSASMNDNVSDITIDGISISKDNKYHPNAKIEIKYYGNALDYDLKEENELSLYYAKKAFEEYGERLYPYGFKCHWWIGLINQEQSEDGKTWFFKVEVTIENAYGNKYSAIAEGKVTGNDYNQIVTGFYVK